MKKHEKTFNTDKYDAIIMCADVDAKMHKVIRDLVTELKKDHAHDTIFLVLRTMGGIPMYAYRTMKLLEARYSTIYCLVPDLSMSAGTLMALGSNAIGMFEDSCLGPLDLQIPHPDLNEDTHISTLDVRAAASNISFEASIVATRMLAKGMQDGLRRNMSERMATRLVSALYSPIMDKIDPYHLQESSRNAELSTEYAKRLLLSRMKKQKNEAARISSKLANGYVDHGYAITADEARELGLDVFDLNQLPIWDQMNEIYANISDGAIIKISSIDMQEKTNKENKEAKC